MAENNSILIVGDNLTSHRLQDKLSESNCFSHIHLLSQSDHRYFPRQYRPQLLAGILSIEEMETPQDWYRARNIRYICRHTEPDIDYAAVIDTRPDDKHVSVLKTTGDRSLYIPLHTPESIKLAKSHLNKSGSVVIIGNSEIAIQYAINSARAGFQAYLISEKNTFINPLFDKITQTHIYREIIKNGVKIISPTERHSIPNNAPFIFMPMSKKRKSIHPNTEMTLTPSIKFPDGGDHFKTPESLINTFASRCVKTLTGSYIKSESIHKILSKNPDLPHRISVDKLAIHYAGTLNQDKKIQCATMHIPEYGTYRKIFISDNHIVGFILVGDIRGSETLTDMMLIHQDIHYCRDQLLFTGQQSAITYP
ncbi:MAG: NAD-binding protein [Saccharospirillaceae bacterium]|nr:NAD-binding protein [Saccharospirillaceae bacterium]MCD8531726.1 NAD-binding protein [Saccharospirillaceae bacterium]